MTQTPAEFADVMLGIVDPKDPEIKKLYEKDPDLMEILARNIMESVLSDLGYSYGVSIFRKALFRNLAIRAEKERANRK